MKTFKQFKCKNQTFWLVTYVLEIHPLRMKFARLFDSAFCLILNVIKKCLTVYVQVHIYPSLSQSLFPVEVSLIKFLKNATNRLIRQRTSGLALAE